MEKKKQHLCSECYLEREQATEMKGKTFPYERIIDVLQTSRYVCLFFVLW